MKQRLPRKLYRKLRDELKFSSERREKFNHPHTGGWVWD
jgi:hypothetical protein